MRLYDDTKELTTQVYSFKKLNGEKAGQRSTGTGRENPTNVNQARHDKVPGSPRGPRISAYLS